MKMSVDEQVNVEKGDNDGGNVRKAGSSLARASLAKGAGAAATARTRAVKGTPEERSVIIRGPRVDNKGRWQQMVDSPGIRQLTAVSP